MNDVVGHAVAPAVLAMFLMRLMVRLSDLIS